MRNELNDYKWAVAPRRNKLAASYLVSSNSRQYGYG
jgi:hypothetical protein